MILYHEIPASDCCVMGPIQEEGMEEEGMEVQEAVSLQPSTSPPPLFLRKVLQKTRMLQVAQPASCGRATGLSVPHLLVRFLAWLEQGTEEPVDQAVVRTIVVQTMVVVVEVMPRCW